MESLAQDIREDLADELELRPEQKPAFDALMDQYQQAVFDWRATWRRRSISLKEALEAEPTDIAAVRSILKGYVGEKPGDAEVEALIDRTVDFYVQLDPEQQEKIRARLVKKLRRHY